MLFHAMMEFCLDLLGSKFWLIGEWSIHEENTKEITAMSVVLCEIKNHVHLDNV
jgi:hypothetical protein